jgi:hypothetical protein
MSNSEDTTQPIGTADYADPARTRTDLRALIIDAMREVADNEILPIIRAEFDAVKRELRELREIVSRNEERLDRMSTLIRSSQVNTVTRLSALEDAVEEMGGPHL